MVSKFHFFKKSSLKPLLILSLVNFNVGRYQGTNPQLSKNHSTIIFLIYLHSAIYLGKRIFVNTMNLILPKGDPRFYLV